MLPKLNQLCKTVVLIKIWFIFSLQLLIAICSLGNISAPAVPETEPEVTSQTPTELTSQASCPLYEEWKECAPHVCQPSCGGGIFHCPNVSVYNNFCHTKCQELIEVSFTYKLVFCHMWTFKTIWFYFRFATQCEIKFLIARDCNCDWRRNILRHAKNSHESHTFQRFNWDKAMELDQI